MNQIQLKSQGTKTSGFFIFIILFFSTPWLPAMECVGLFLNSTTHLKTSRPETDLKTQSFIKILQTKSILYNGGKELEVAGIRLQTSSGERSFFLTSKIHDNVKLDHFLNAIFSVMSKESFLSTDIFKIEIFHNHPYRGFSEPLSDADRGLATTLKNVFSSDYHKVSVDIHAIQFNTPAGSHIYSESI